MNPHLLRIENVGRFTQAEVAFPAGTIAIVGPNGSGKSTLLNCVEVSLFGEGARDLAPMLAPFSDSLLIELRFEHDGRDLLVRRTYRRTGSGGKVTFDLEEFVEGEFVPLTRETTAATQAHLNAILGLSRRTFAASAFLRQGDAANFAEASAVDRKAILGEVLDPHSLWPRLADRAKADAKALEGELSWITTTIGDREQRVENLPALQEQLRIRTTEETLFRAALQDAEAALEQAQAELAGNAAAAERVQTLTLARDHAAVKHGDAVLAIQHAQHALTQLPDARQLLKTMQASAELVPGLEERLDEQRRQQAEAQALSERRAHALARVVQVTEQTRLAHAASEQAGRTFDDRDAKFQQLQNAADGAEHCDRCIQILGAEARAAAITSLDAECTKLAKDFEKLTEAAQVADEALAVARAEADQLPAPAITQVEDIATPLAQARESAKGIPTAEQNLRVLTEQADRVADQMAACAETQEALTAADAELAAATQGVKNNVLLTQRVAEARETVATRRSSLEATVAEVVRTRQTVEQLQAEAAELITLRAKQTETNARLDLLRLAERAYGRDGIPTLIAENVLPQVESEANRILTLMPTAKGETLRLELHTQRVLKSADHLRETLDIVVEDQFGPRAYESYSGGEKGRLNVALRLALAFLLTSRRGAESKVLVLDEVPYLDALGEEQLVAVIASVAGVYDRVLTVAHSAGVADAFETVIEIETDSRGASRVVGDREPVAA